MKIVLLVEHALMNALLKQLKKATFMLLILKFALIVVLVPMFVRLKQFTRNKICNTNFQKKEAIRKIGLLFFLPCMFRVSIEDLLIKFCFADC
jgi:hypothetical protein